MIFILKFYEKTQAVSFFDFFFSYIFASRYFPISLIWNFSSNRLCKRDTFPYLIFFPLGYLFSILLKIEDFDYIWNSVQMRHKNLESSRIFCRRQHRDETNLLMIFHEIWQQFSFFTWNYFRRISEMERGALIYLKLLFDSSIKCFPISASFLPGNFIGFVEFFFSIAFLLYE